MLLVKLKPADVACGKATLRTSPSCGQATISFQLRHPKLLACHSRAATEGLVNALRQPGAISKAPVGRSIGCSDTGMWWRSAVAGTSKAQAARVAVSSTM